MLTEAERAAIEAELHDYPYRQNACISALRIVQQHREGWVSDEAIQDIAQFLEMTPDEVDSIATFYNLIHRRPVGQHIIRVCTSVSCWLLGYERIRRHLSERLEIPFGQTTADGRFTMLPIQCLGTCDHAPALMIDEELHRDLTPEKIDEILETYRAKDS